MNLDQIKALPHYKEVREWIEHSADMVENKQPIRDFRSLVKEVIALAEETPKTETRNIQEVGSDRQKAIWQMAKDQHECEGTLEVDTPTEISEGDDNGAYVKCWVWVDFSGTDLDKEVAP